MPDFLKESCGVFGAYDFEQGPVLPYLYWGLISQNHRGHQSYGFLTYDEEFKPYNRLGLVPPVRYPPIRKLFRKKKGNVGISHVRYVPSGAQKHLLRDAQPFVAERGNTKIGIAYNGNLVNIAQLREDLRKELVNFYGFSDSEILTHQLIQELLKTPDLKSSVSTLMAKIEGSFSVVGLDRNGKLFAFRDPCGIKPLCYGRSYDGRIYAVSSESIGLSINSFRYEGEVKPGELLAWSKDGFEREQLVKQGRKAFCCFEFAYFAQPDSILSDGGKPVYKIREEFGRNLGREDPDITKKIDVVLSIPETADDAAYGLHEQTGLPWERGLKKHRFLSDRAFITPAEDRDMIISRKINVPREEMKGKRVGVVEDSIVRGDTSRRIVKKIREAGATEVHMYVTFPKIISPCFYGIDMATFGELIGARYTHEEIAKIIGADSIHYQSLEGFVRATGLKRDELCLGCITGAYLTPLAEKIANKMRSRFEKGKKKLEGSTKPFV